MKELTKYWTVFLSALGLVIWLVQLEARVTAVDENVKQRQKVEEKVVEKIDSLQDSIYEVKIGVSRLETILKQK